ncbi:hypothetical protein A2U01_0101559, partial [Trifolium medium]|nr:hypothetical protein [Trifolium medium]
VIVHARKNTQLAMGSSRPGEDSLTTAPFLVKFGRRLRTLGNPNLSSAASTIPASKR